MPLFLVRNDITKMKTDAIVNAANRSLLGGGGVDGAIHRAAGPELLKECRTLGGCETGEAKLTRGCKLPAKYVIHTVGPVWRGGSHGERELLESCYRNSLALAKENGIESIAFPLISSGVYGYPKEEAFAVAEETILEFLRENEMTVFIVFFGHGEGYFDSDAIDDLRRFFHKQLSDEMQGSTLFAAKRADAHGFASAVADTLRPNAKKAKRCRKNEAQEDTLFEAETSEVCADEDYDDIRRRLDEQLDESFTEMLLRKIDESGMTDAQCYKKANIDRKLFSKIRSDRLYRPSKQTALAFAIALELSLDETASLLAKAGYALSHASRFDIIVEYFIERRNYNIFEINEALFAFDQALLG